MNYAALFLCERKKEGKRTTEKSENARLSFN